MLEVVSARPHGPAWLFRLKGIESRDAAEGLRGCVAQIPRSEAAPLPEGRYYEHEILGMTVRTEDGEVLGEVTQVIATGANDIYAVGKLLIPATRDAVLRLDPAEGEMVVRSRRYLEGEDVG